MMSNVTNSVRCLRCQSLVTSQRLAQAKVITFSHQKFFVWTCQNCQQTSYYWQTDSVVYHNCKKIHVVLHNPEIAGNVGTILRLAVAFNFKVHLIEPFGFIFSKKWLNRSSTNHFELVDYQLYSSWSEFLTKEQPKTLVMTTSKTDKPLKDLNFVEIPEKIYLVFGCESKGLPKKLLIDHPNSVVRIYHSNQVSSINLATAVAIFVYSVHFQYHQNFFPFLT